MYRHYPITTTTPSAAAGFNYESVSERGEIVPLGQTLPAAPSQSVMTMVRNLVIALIVIALVVWVVREVLASARGSRKLERNDVVQRMSTKELAKRLYERLEKRGGANPTTMRSLEHYSNKG